MNTKEKFAYAALHPLTVALHLLGQIILGMFIMHPVFVAISLFFAVVVCFFVCGKSFLKELKFYLPFYIIVALSNPLFSHSGATPLFFLNGKPITYEATIYGIVSSGMFLSVLLWCRVWNGIMTEDKLVFLVGRRLPKIGLVLTISLRMIPRFRNKWWEIREVQSTLGDFAESGFIAQIKGAVKLFSALITHAMESAVETGMSMSARGYGLKGRSSLVLYKIRPYDIVFMCGNLFTFVAIIVGIAMGFIDYQFYPTVTPVECGSGTTGMFVLFAMQSALLVLQAIKEEAVWKYSRSRI